MCDWMSWRRVTCKSVYNQYIFCSFLFSCTSHPYTCQCLRLLFARWLFTKPDLHGFVLQHKTFLVSFIPLPLCVNNGYKTFALCRKGNLQHGLEWHWILGNFCLAKWEPRTIYATSLEMTPQMGCKFHFHNIYVWSTAFFIRAWS